MSVQSWGLYPENKSSANLGCTAPGIGLDQPAGRPGQNVRNDHGEMTRNELEALKPFSCRWGKELTTRQPTLTDSISVGLRESYLVR